MLISKSAKHNPNYLAKVIIVKNLRKHPNADRLLVFTVDGNDVITSNATQEGQLSIYFPLECQINFDYLSLNNEFRDKALNANKEEVGFFDAKGRVKAVKLRGQKSEGYVVPVSTLEPLIGDKYQQLSAHVGEEFDTINGVLLVNKYVIKQKSDSGLGNLGKSPKIKKSKLIDNQFRLHYDTAQLGKNLHRIQPDDIISISWKLHGTSFVSSRVLCKRPLKWYERALKYVGVRIDDKEYDNIYSSRKVIKNGDISKNPSHYYGYDLWSDINDRIKDSLHDGESIYGECVGFTKDGGYIQSQYDYGCKPAQNEIYIYRITMTNTEGKVIDLPFNMVQERCEQLGLKAVPLIFMGRAQELYPYVAMNVKMDGVSMTTIEEWREQFLAHLKGEYVYDQDCQFCVNKVPAEGVVVRVEGLKAEALKLKAFRFLEGESKALDKGETNIEDEES